MGRRGAIALAASAVLVAGCSGGSGNGKPHGAPSPSGGPAPTVVVTRSVIVRPVAYVVGTKSHTIVSRATVTMSRASGPVDVKLVGATQTHVQWGGAAWDAVAAALLRDGDEFTGRRFTFRVSGPVDGTSAGALFTVAVLALLRGDALRRDVTLTGTVAPDGTIEPVAGAASKAAAAASAGIATLLVPVGDRPASVPPHVSVREVADIADAYFAFTGRRIPAIGPSDAISGAPSENGLRALVNANLARVQRDAKAVAALLTALRRALAETIRQATTDAGRASALERAGALAGAFRAARDASTTADAAARAGSFAATFVTKGYDSYAAQIQAEQQQQGDEQLAQVARLSRFRPRSLGDVSALLAAFAAVGDAVAVAPTAYDELHVVHTLTGKPVREAGVQNALAGSFYLELERGLVAYSGELLTVARQSGGPAPHDAARVDAMASFFTAAASANVKAFNETVVASPIRELSPSATLAYADLDYAIANETRASDPTVGAGANAAYARLAVSIDRFLRSANLLDKYAAFAAHRDARGAIAVSDGAALSSAVARGASQLGQSLAALAAARVAPMLERGAGELGAALARGSVEDRLGALAVYHAAFVTSRVLARLGGL